LSENKHITNLYRCRTIAIENCHLDIVKFLHPTPTRFTTGVYTCNYAVHAAEYGHLEILEWLYKNGYPMNDKLILNVAALHGHLGIIKYLCENRYILPSFAEACLGAASKGHLEILKYLRENGYLWSVNECIRAAANNGHDEIVKYLS